MAVVEFNLASPSDIPQVTEPGAVRLLQLPNCEMFRGGQGLHTQSAQGST